ncbi:MAG: hypothetical protein K2X38_07450 [Gemmataceae bacterium]|nr:hypothetical protein [Gemmataceae bacterium]
MRTRWLAVAAFFTFAAFSQADSFDWYTNPLLAKSAKASHTEKVAKITHETMVGNSRVLPGVPGAFVVVKTNEGRWAKVLLHPGQQKIPDTDMKAPIAIIERFVTFREADEKTVHSKGEKVQLFADFRFNLDMGQVVPASIPADLKFIVEGENAWVEPVGKAELYLVKRHLEEATPKKLEKVVVGEKFEPKYFNGVYKLNDDGRRSGELHLSVKETGEVFGHLYSDKDGQKYEVEGKVGAPPHTIQFRVTLPRTIQFYTGWMFTADGKAITGVARMQERETGFYAIRKE